MSSVASNKDVIRHYFEDLWGKAAVEQAERLIAPDAVGYYAGVTGPSRILSSVTGRVREEHAAFPDVTFVVEDLIAEGDRVAARVTVTGTQTGSLRGIPPSGRAMQKTIVGIYRVENSQIVEAWIVWDELSALRQLGQIDQILAWLQSTAITSPAVPI